MFDLLLIMTLGFLGSFGHCLGMCGPLTVAFSLSQASKDPSNWLSSLGFHLLLNGGRIVSYALVGAGLGGVGSLLIASGQLAGIGSGLRQVMTLVTGLLLIWVGLIQIQPNWLPHLPSLHPIQGKLHHRLGAVMTQLSLKTQVWTPALLGCVWGLLPCGFLYIAQIKAVETGNLWQGAATMFAFGLGTLPMMLGVGISTSRLSGDQRSQLFRLGGWITLLIGIVTLLRSDAMLDYTGHGSLLLLMLALIARPIHHFWSQPLQYRRLLGVGAFVLAIAHTTFMLEHTLDWNLAGIPFLLTKHQIALMAGILALLLMTPAACTSFDYWQKILGKRWRQIHLLCVPALILSVLHTIFLGSHYLGDLKPDGGGQWRSVALIILLLVVLLLRFIDNNKPAKL